MPAAPVLLLLKAHNKGYTKKDGTVVKPFDTKAPDAKEPLPGPKPPPGSNPHLFLSGKKAAMPPTSSPFIYPAKVKPGEEPPLQNPALAPKSKAPGFANSKAKAAYSEKLAEEFLADPAAKGMTFQQWLAGRSDAPAAGAYKPPKWSALGSMKAKGSAPAAKPGTGLYGGFMAPDHAKDLGQPLPAGGGGQKSLFGGGSGKGSYKPPLPKSAVAHPKRGEKGEVVMIHYPSKPTDPSTWHDPAAIATFTPGCALPEELNGIPLASWAGAPSTPEGWDYVDGQNDELEEPGMDLPKGKVPASGVIVMEPDGRVWVVAPTNRFGATINTFPKGSRDFGLSLQANAIKEAYEESGLKVEIDSFLGDVTRSTSVARYYLARRVGGTPADAGWESQAVRLVPAGKLREFLDRGEDRKVAEWLEGLV